MSAAQNPITTVVLTSRRNFVWHSMQEIIPAIEELWLATQGVGNHEVHVIDVEQGGISRLFPVLLRAQNIVLGCFTPALARMARLFRTELGIDARFFIYLHNQATIACWPFREWGLGDVLRSSDVFLSSCSLDAEALGLSLPEARVAVIPFTFSREAYPELIHENGPSSRKRRFIYVGRLSPQKNLHALFCALRMLADQGEEFELHVFGKDDAYGSPNMGMEFAHYDEYLRKLAVQLGLADRIHFRGHCPRSEIDPELAREDTVFVSASLHSDENFGMAAFRALCFGGQAVLSEWGGHADFKKSFADQVHYVPVHASPAGAFVSVQELAERLKLAIGASSIPRLHLPDPYQFETLVKQLARLAEEELPPSIPLRFTELADRIWESRGRRLHESAQQSKIFDSYADPDAQLFFRGYGMRDSAPARKEGVLCTYPWVSLQQGRAVVDDPHRGHFEFEGTSIALAEKLVEHGFGHREIRSS